MDENLVCVFKAKIDYFTVFSRPKFMDENLVCVFKAKIDYFTYFQRPKFMDGQVDRREKSLLNPQTGFLAMLTSIPEAQFAIFGDLTCDANSKANSTFLVVRHQFARLN